MPTPIDKALTGEWYEIKEARKALDSAAARMDDLQREREKYFQDRRQCREALAGLVSVIEAAGVRQLSTGVELGQVVWAMKMADALEFANETLNPTQP